MYSYYGGEYKPSEALYQAVQDGDVIKIKDVAKKDGLSSSLRSTLICIALSHEREDVTRFLIEHESKEQRHNGNITSGKETPLHLVCRSRWRRSLLGKNVEIAKLLLKNGAQVNAQDYLGRTPLHFCRDIELAKILLDKNASVDIRDESGLSPLIRMLSNRRDAAFIRSCFKLIDKYQLKPDRSEQYSLLQAWVMGHHDDGGFRELLKHGIDARARSESGQNVLHFAVRKGRVCMVGVLKQYGIDVNAVDDKGCTLIHTLLDTNELFAGEYLDVLLRDNPEIDVNIEDNNSRTPLLIMIGISKRRARGYCTDIIERLLNHGANIFMPMSDGKTAFQQATQSVQIIFVELIAKYGGMMRILDKNGNTVLHAIGQSYTADYFVYKSPDGLDVNVVNNSGETPLQLASKAGRAATVDSLLNNGAGKLNDGRTIDGLTPLHMASVQSMKDNVFIDETKFADIIARHLAQGLDIDTRDKLGKTSLHYAIESGRIYKVKQLLDSGADVNAADNIGKNPLYRAIESGSDQVLKVLLERGVDVTTRFFDGTTCLHLAIRLLPDPDAYSEKEFEYIFNILALIKHFEKNHLDLDLLQEYDIYTPLYYATQISPEFLFERLLLSGASLDKMYWIAGDRLITYDNWTDFRLELNAFEHLRIKLYVANLGEFRCHPSSLRDPEYREKCQEEVGRLKRCKISGQMSYYDFLHTGDPLAAKDIMNDDKGIDRVPVDFPIYAGLIKSKIEADLYRVNLLQSATDRLSYYLNRSSYLQHSSLPVDVVSRISVFLNNHDLLRISRPDIWKKSVFGHRNINEDAFYRAIEYIYPIDR